MREITYREFSRLAKKRGWTVDMLVELFKGGIGVDDREDYFHESLKNHFERILTCRWLNPETRRTEDRSKVVIAYRSVIEFYLRELHASEDTVGPVTVRHNRHGGTRQGAGRKKAYHTQAEKMQEYRKRKKAVSVYTKSSSQPRDFVQ